LLFTAVTRKPQDAASPPKPFRFLHLSVSYVLLPFFRFFLFLNAVPAASVFIFTLLAFILMLFSQIKDSARLNRSFTSFFMKKRPRVIFRAVPDKMTKLIQPEFHTAN
jgi:hypothetical protein